MNEYEKIKETGKGTSMASINGLSLNTEEIGHRIRSIRKHYNLSQCDFAENLEISRKWLSELENGKKVPSGLFLLGMECRFAASRDWILNDEGSMLVCAEWDESCAETVMLIKAFSRLSKDGRANLLNVLSAFLMHEDHKI